MKTLVSLAAVALALSAGSALAADLPSRKGPPAYAPPPPLWTGFYVGLNAGYSWGANSGVYASGYGIVDNLVLVAEQNFASLSALSATGGARASGDGFIGGGQIGYNFQWANNIVAGFEADIQGATIHGSGGFVGFASLLDPLGRPSDVYSAIRHERSVDWLGTVRGRLGYLVTPTLLAFVTGGLAYGGVTTATTIAQAWGGTGNGSRLLTTGGAGSFSDTRVGWTAGGGLEWMFMPNWSAKLEYLYYDLGSVTWNSGPAASYFPSRFGPDIGAIGLASQTRFNGHIARAGVNYHFSWGASAPVVTNY